MDKQHYFVVYLEETDGGIIWEKIQGYENVMKFIAKHNLSTAWGECVIIAGGELVS